MPKPVSSRLPAGLPAARGRRGEGRARGAAPRPLGGGFVNSGDPGAPLLLRGPRPPPGCRGLGLLGEAGPLTTAAVRVESGSERDLFPKRKSGNRRQRAFGFRGRAPTRAPQVSGQMHPDLALHPGPREFAGAAGFLPGTRGRPRTELQRRAGGLDFDKEASLSAPSGRRPCRTLQTS